MPEVQPAHGATPMPTPRPVRVVVADDSEDMRLLLRLAMEQRTDVELVAEARDGAEAIDLVAALRPDLLVLDVEMPVLDGISALPQMRDISPDTRVVMLSATSSDDRRARAYSAGAAAFVQKGGPIMALVDELLGAADLLDVLIRALAPASTARELDRDSQTPARARRFVSAALAEWGEAGLADTVELLVSELVTNVVVHTDTAPYVSVRLLPDVVHVEVIDSDPTPPVPRDADRTATNGRGLAFVDMLATAWGSAPADQGKVIWFDVARTTGRR